MSTAALRKRASGARSRLELAVPHQCERREAGAHLSKSNGIRGREQEEATWAVVRSPAEVCGLNGNAQHSYKVKKAKEPDGWRLEATKQSKGDVNDENI